MAKVKASKIKASKIWNTTSFFLTAGKKYTFSAIGKWNDWKTECGATGYDSDKLHRFESLRRCEHAKWFSLIGALDKDKSTCFDVGRLIESGETYTPDRSGTLYCFANDVIFMYWNNSGEIELEMECLE